MNLNLTHIHITFHTKTYVPEKHVVKYIIESSKLITVNLIYLQIPYLRFNFLFCATYFQYNLKLCLTVFLIMAPNVLYFQKSYDGKHTKTETTQQNKQIEKFKAMHNLIN